MTEDVEKVRACRIAQVEIETQILEVELAIEKIQRAPKCPTCCAHKGQPCHTRNGNLRMYVHVPRLHAGTPTQDARRAKLHGQLDALRRQQWDLRTGGEQ